MKQKRKIISVSLLVIILMLGLAYYFMGQRSDACSALDRLKHNCVPAGRCALPGDPSEAFVDCEIKNYDHKFRQ